jgi:hypothetical protein
MAKLTLRPWKYPKNKKMLLYWLCSPYRSANGKWTIRAIFVSAADEERGLFEDGIPTTYDISEFPWGLLPNLRVGRIYVNGILQTDSIQETKRLYISNLQDGSICSAFQIPKQLYSFFDNKMLGDEKIWRFKVGNEIYYLPCLELIRAFFAPSKTLTNQLLKPTGLEDLIEDSGCVRGELHITLSSDIPQSIVNDEMVTHLLWLTHNETAKTGWHKVYSGVFAKAHVNLTTTLNAALAKGLPLETIPPLENQCELIFTSTNIENSHLIHELFEVFGLPKVPFQNVKYKHASFRGTFENNNINKANKKIVLLDRDERYTHTGKRRRAKKMSKQPLAEIPRIVLGFDSLPQITKQTVASNPFSSEKEFIAGKQHISSNKKTSAVDKKEVGVDEPFFGGEIKPIEFAGLKLLEKSEDQGLNDIILTLNFLSKLNLNLKTDYQICNLPGDFPFCFIKGRVKRNFAIATLFFNGGEPIYLIEVSRPDNWQISTLLVKFDSKKMNLKESGQILQLIVKKMIENDGHWVLESLEQATKFRFKRVKHFKGESIESFAIAVNKQLHSINHS